MRLASFAVLVTTADFCILWWDTGGTNEPDSFKSGLDVWEMQVLRRRDNSQGRRLLRLPRSKLKSPVGTRRPEQQSNHSAENRSND